MKGHKANINGLTGNLSWRVKIFAGFSYIEVLVATFLITATLLPAMNLLFNAIQGSTIQTAQSAGYHSLTGKMEEVLSKPLSELHQEAVNAASSQVIIDDWSDSVGSSQRRIVYLAYYDGDNADSDNNVFTGTEENLLWLQVQIEGSNIYTETLIWAEP